MTTKYVQRDGIHVAYDVQGQGPPLLLHHGWAGCRAGWHRAGYVRELSREFCVLTIDARGRGDSDKPDQPAAYSIGEHARDVAAVLGEERIERAAVWGYSFGGDVLLELAKNSPAMISAVVAMSTCARVTASPVEDIVKGVSNMLSNGMAQHLEMVQNLWAPEEWVMSLMGKSDPVALAASRVAVELWEGIDWQSGVLPPVMLAVGEREPIYQAVLACARQRPETRIHVVPQAGHIAVFTEISRTLPAVRAFLRESADDMEPHGAEPEE